MGLHLEKGALKSGPARQVGGVSIGPFFLQARFVDSPGLWGGYAEYQYLASVVVAGTGGSAVRSRGFRPTWWYSRSCASSVLSA